MVGNPWAAAAALLLMFSLGMLLWNVRLQQSVRREGAVETVAVQPTDPASGVDGHLTYLEDRGVAILTVRDLPPLAPEQVYEVWLIGDDDAPVPAGVFDEPATDYAVAVDRRRFRALAITVEPGPLGSPSPTREPFVVAPLPTG